MSDQHGTDTWKRSRLTLKIALTMVVVAVVCVGGFLVSIDHMFDAVAAQLSGVDALHEARRRITLWAIIVGVLGCSASMLLLRLLVTPMLRVNREMLDKLTRTTEDALATARGQGQFLANMSHEIRTPMNGVLGMAGLLLRTELDPKQRRYVESIEKAGAALLTILNDVLDFSKIEAGKPELRPVDCDLPLMTQDVVELLAPRAESKGLRLAYRVDKDVPELVFTDVDRLRQIAINLIGNAIKFSERGEVTVRLQRLPDRDGLSWMRWDVTDTGIGISVADQARVFESFSQADSSMTRSRGGTGLGLAISRRLVEAMGGTIGVESDLGIGSNFWFSVPVGKETRREADRSRRVSLPSLAPIGPMGTVQSRFDAESRHVLVVEDNEINQLVAVELLHALGLTADVARNGREAVTAAMTTSYVAILMDCQMPEMDGYEATRQIRNSPGDCANTPIIALTAHAMEGERQKVLDAGMDDYLAKPVRFGALEKTLRHWVALPPATIPPPGLPPDDRSPSSAVEAHQLLDPTSSRSPRVLELSLKLLPETIASMDQAVKANDAAQVRDLAHRLKGSCLSIGASALADHADRVFRDGDSIDARLGVERLKVLCARTLVVLQHELDMLSESES